jgi:D-aspartate ligase
MLTDKWCFARILEALGVPRPKTILLQSLQEMSELPDSCFDGTFLKPLNSQVFSLRTGVKAFMLESKDQALAIMRRLQRAGTGEFPILLQEYIPGPARQYYLVDGFVDRHKQIRALFARQRLRMYPPVFGNSSLSETIPLDRVQSAIETLEKLWATVEYRGIFDAEFKYDDRDGEFKILEINARPWWFIEFAVRCGVDVCRMSYQDALDLPIESKYSYDIGRRCTHLLMDLAGLWETDQSADDFWRWLRSLKNMEDILYRWDDPKPAISFTLESVRRRLGRLLRGESFAPSRN